MMNKGEVNVLKLPENVPVLGKMMKTKWLLGIIAALLAIAVGLTTFLFWPRSQKVYTDTLETVLDKIYTTTTYYDALYPNGGSNGNGNNGNGNDGGNGGGNVNNGGTTSETDLKNAVYKADDSYFRLGSSFLEDGYGAAHTVLNPYGALQTYAIDAKAEGNTAYIVAGGQKVEFVKDNDGNYVMKTYVKKNDNWTVFFDAGMPIIQGEAFNAYPTNAEVVTNTADKKVLKLSGTASKGYYFEYLLTVEKTSPNVHFEITSKLTSDLVLNGQQPIIMLWKNGTDQNKLSINQEVPNYQTVDDTVYWKSGFPATYMYTDGMESGIYFNMTPMTWYSMHGGVKRFRVSQARTVERGGKTGCGLDIRGAQSTATIKAGDMVVDFYLFANGDVKKPTKLEALNKLVENFGTTLPSSAEQPKNYVDETKTTYKDYVQQITKNLLVDGVTYQIQSTRSQTEDGVIGWTDGPVFTNRFIDRILHRPGYAIGCSPSGTGPAVSDKIYGDWNCNANTIIPWIAYNRLNTNPLHKRFLQFGLDSMNLYFDRQARLIRSFEAYDGYAGSGKEFTFQNYFFQHSTLWASNMVTAEDFDPALNGKFLMSTQGMRTIAHNVDYVFPQLMDIKTMSAAESIDEKELGVTREVWGGATYAYNMCLAYDQTGNKTFMNEAKTAIDKLFNNMSFYVNDLKQKLYTDPYEFPINEVSTAPWGVAACQLLYRYTGDAKYLQYSKDIRNMTLRMMNWFESGLADDPTDQSVASLGLMHAFSKTDTTCSWENIMTYMPMITEFKNLEIAPDSTMLKLYNIFRSNAFYFMGPSWNPATVSTASRYTAGPAGYLAVEDYYSAETPTPMGNFGPNTYMSNAPMYCYLLYEAYASASDKAVMAMNLDIVDAQQKMTSGVERNYIFYNGADQTKSFKMTFKDLNANAQYRMTSIDSSGKVTSKTLKGSELMAGVSCSLKEQDYVRVSVKCLDTQIVSDFVNMQRTQRALSAAYATIQDKGEVEEKEYIESQKKAGKDELDISISEMTFSTVLLNSKQYYETALEQYKKQEYAKALQTLGKIKL